MVKTKMSKFLIGIWYWFWYFRKGKAKFWVTELVDDTFVAYGTNGEITVTNCYGSTPELALEIAKYKFKQASEKS